MLTINRILKTNGVTGEWSDEFGQVMDTPTIAIGMRCRFRLTLCSDRIDEDGRLIPIPYGDLETVSYYIALDSDYLQETTPKLRNTTGCSLECDADTGGAVFVCDIPNTAVPDLLQHIGAAKTIPLETEIAGMEAADGVASFLIQTTINVRNRVWLPGSGTPPEDVVNDPEYWPGTQIEAYLSQTPELQFSADGTSWHDDLTLASDVWWRWRFGMNGQWTKAYPLPHGANGKDFAPDAIGLLKDRPAAPANGYCYVATDTRKCYWYLSGAWSEGVSCGVDGEGVYALAVRNGFAGSETDYLASLKGQSAYELAQEHGYEGSASEWLESLRGLQGEPGRDLHVDATGTIDELEAYDDEVEGFVFASSETDEKKHCTVLTLFIKKSDTHADWYPPLDITWYSQAGENAALVEPITFHAPANGESVYAWDMSAFPASTIAAVCINTDEGEVRLPYNSEAGVRKIVLSKDGKTRIYFGSKVPEYETGKIYFAQGLSGLTQFEWYQKSGGTMTFDEWYQAAVNLIPEAPDDGNFYCRKNKKWVAVNVSALGGVTVSGTASYNATATVGSAFALTFDAAASDGSDVTVVLKSGTLPAGLTLSGKTLSGTPTAEGSAMLVFTASNGAASMEITVVLTIGKAAVMYYGYVPYSVAGNIQTVTTVTEAMLKDSRSTIVQTAAQTLDRTSLGNVPAGAWVVVMLPKASNLKALKYDGVGGYTIFAQNNGAANSGANGTEVVIGGVIYRCYGQLNLATSELYIKTEKI